MNKKYLYPLIYVLGVLLIGLLTRWFAFLIYSQDGFSQSNYSIIILTRLTGLIIPLFVVWILRVFPNRYRLIKAYVIVSIVDGLLYLLFVVFGFIIQIESVLLPIAMTFMVFIGLLGLCGIGLFLAVIFQPSYHLNIRISVGVILLSHIFNFVFFNQAVMYLTRLDVFDSVSVSSISTVSMIFTILNIIAFAFLLYTIFNEEEKNEYTRTMESLE